MEKRTKRRKQQNNLRKYIDKFVLTKFEKKGYITKEKAG
jgi:hypothetical protein